MALQRPQPPTAANEITAQAASVALATEQPATPTSTTPTISISTSSSTTPAPIIEQVVEYEPLASTGYITQAELTSQLQQLSSALVGKFNATPTPPLPQNVLGDGNPDLPYAAENDIDNLSNVTITNANLTASEIPSLNYLSLSGGTLTGPLNVSTLNASSTTFTAFSATNATSTNFASTNASTTNATSTTLFSTFGDFTTGLINTLTGTTLTYTAASTTNLTATNATSTNFFATTASSTNLFAQAASLGSLSAGSLSLSAPLSVSSGGTGLSSIAAGFLPFGAGGSALATSSLLYWDNVHGRLGIGTTSPTAILTLDSSSTSGTILRVSNSSPGGHIYDWLSTGSGNTGGAGRLDLYDFTAGVPRLSIAANGNIGVGTTSPAYALDVNGDINVNGYYRYGGNPFIIASSTLGNTFIGLSAGNANVLGQGDTAIGYQAGQSLTLPASGVNPQNDTFLGYEAGQNCTSCRESTIIGYQAGQAYVGNGQGVEDGINTMIGSYAGKYELGQDEVFVGQKAGVGMASSTDTNNVFVGTHSGTDWVSGSNNIFVGRVADNATSGSTGSGNVMLGYNAGDSLGAKNDNVFIGQWAGYSQTIADGNTFIGYNSGSLNTIGTGNTYLGFDTGQSAVTGGNNTFLGYQAGQNATSSNNVIIGFGAGPATITADQQTLIGAQTGNHLTSGADNVLLGYQAGLNLTSGAYNAFLGPLTGTNITSGSNNILIGNNISLASTTNSNQLDIGNLIYASGLGSNGTGAASGNVGIGSSSPSYMLTVVGTNSSGMFLSDPSGNDQMQIDANTNSQAILAFSAGASTKGRIFSQTTSGNTGLILQTGAGNSHQGLQIGNNNIGIDLPNFPTTLPVNALDIEGGVAIGSPYAGTSTAPSNGLLVSGNVGIGTSTPYGRLEVWGPDTASTSAFVVANNASTTEFAVYDTGNAALAGGLIQNSDQRLKTNVQPLNASSSLSLIDQLNPVTFNWIDPNKGTTPQLGFIAQQVLPLFPNLVATTAPTELTPDGTLSLNYIDLISPIVSAIQALSSEISSIENTISGFAQSFTTNELTFNRATGGVITSNQDNTQELCIGSTCITGAQLQALLAAAGQTEASDAGSGGSASDNSQANDTPPVIQINGDNPAIVQVGATYNDLGATITGPTADLNLDIQTFVNGSPMNPVQIDTSAAATDTIDYVVTDQNGLTSTSTRTIIVQAPQTQPDTDASSSGATSTGQ